MPHTHRLFTLTLLLSFIAAAPETSAADMELDRINKSVVKVFSTSRAPDYYRPWQYRGQNSVIGSGVIIAGRRILTNAHVVGDSVFIQIKKANDPNKYLASIEFIGHQCDLALLKVEDPSFFDDTEPLELGGLPKLQDEVAAFGFPRGGAEISITKGIVSRIEQMKYSYSDFALLGAQIDAAINPGNSGGPVLKDGKITGIAMQALRSGENIGYIIPTPIIRHFLEDSADGRYDGFPDTGIVGQRLENESLRRYYGLKKGETGVLARRVIYGGSAYGIVREGDVITSIDGVAVANNGSVPLGENIRVSASYLARKHHPGEKLRLGIARGAERMEIEIPLKDAVDIAPTLHGARPSYFIYGGLVFIPLTKNYLRAWGKKWYMDAPIRLVSIARNEYPTKERRQVVFLRNVLAHRINAGYHNHHHLIVDKVNGAKIGDMRDLVAAVKNSDGPYTLFEMDNGIKIAIDNEAARNSEAEILRTYGIPARASEDLR